MLGLFEKVYEIFFSGTPAQVKKLVSLADILVIFLGLLVLLLTEQKLILCYNF